jgi:hypothetical protein
MHMDRLAKGALLIATLTVALCWPAILNRQPLLFPDTPGYLRAGEVVLDVATGFFRPTPTDRVTTPSAAPEPTVDSGENGVSVERSPYFGVLVALLVKAGGTWAVILAQSLIAAIAIVVALRRLQIRTPAQVAIVLVMLAALSGISFFSAAVMPDIFLGLSIIAVAILLRQADSLDWPERAFWTVLVLASALFAKAHLTILTLLIACGAGYLILLRGRRPQAIYSFLAIIVVAIVGFALVNLTVTRMTREKPLESPFLLARVIGDGTAIPYLREVCGQKRWQTCGILNDLPMTENEFLWEPKRAGYGTIDVALKRRFILEQRDIVTGAVTSYPLQQMAASTRNAVEQLATLDVEEYDRMRTLYMGCYAAFCAPYRAYSDSLIMQRQMPLKAPSLAMLVTYLIAAAIGIVLLLGSRPWIRSEAQGSAVPDICAIVMGGVVINAVVTGVVSGVFGRYQARVGWLMLICAAALLAQWLYARRQSQAQLQQTY